MSLDRVNLLNIGLMLLAAGIAFAVPFEAFLVAYSVLGPLHYLTQISWLHDRQYFTGERRDRVGLVVLAIVITVLTLWANGTPPKPGFEPYLVDLTLGALGLALVSVITRDRGLRRLGLAIVVLVTFLLHAVGPVVQLCVVYLPTLIHVFVFTGLFVLYGALRNRSVTGYASLLVFVACGALTLWWDPGTLGYSVSDYARSSYTPFAPMHLFALRDLSGATGNTGSVWSPLGNQAELFTSPASIRTGRLIAFAYLYHYFNWFSKTSVIKWHEVPRARMAAIVVVWIASVTLYAIDFGLGLRWLLLLSLAHVLLEFPLDHKTLLAIGKELASRLRGRIPGRA